NQREALLILSRALQEEFLRGRRGFGKELLTVASACLLKNRDGMRLLRGWRAKRRHYAAGVQYNNDKDYPPCPEIANAGHKSQKAPFLLQEEVSSREDILPYQELSPLSSLALSWCGEDLSCVPALPGKTLDTLTGQA
ncbi:MAG TPA: hypothetical protein VFA15_03995, partial [Nitrososphaera sp.]|nr:hypothetical protein [Nitrososphaera sp.]